VKKLIYLFLLLPIGVLQAQVIANPPDPIIECDVNNPGDQKEIFNLRLRESQVINGQTNVVVTYHLTSGEALSNIGAFQDPENYENIVSPQTIFIRLQNTNNGSDWDVTTMEIIVPIIPVADQLPEDIFIDEGDGDGMAQFDLTENESLILGSQDPFEFQFAYFTSMEDANANDNAITNPEDYPNASNPQLIYVRFAPTIDICDVAILDFSIETDGSLAIDQVFDASIDLYPNPVINTLNVNLEEVGQYEISLYTVNGQRLQSIDFVGNQQAVDVSQLPTGVYFLQISGDKKETVKKVIKQ